MLMSKKEEAEKISNTYICEAKHVFPDGRENNDSIEGLSKP